MKHCPVICQKSINKSNEIHATKWTKLIRASQNQCDETDERLSIDDCIMRFRYSENSTIKGFVSMGALALLVPRVFESVGTSTLVWRKI